MEKEGECQTCLEITILTSCHQLRMYHWWWWLWSHLNGNFLIGTRKTVADYNVLEMEEKWTWTHYRTEKAAEAENSWWQVCRIWPWDICALKGMHLTVLEGSTGIVEWSGALLLIQCHIPPSMRHFIGASSAGGLTRGHGAQLKC